MAAAMLLYWLALAALQLHLISAAPTVLHPLQDQFPPVARVGQQFVFNIFPDTFASPLAVSLGASTLPSWLTFNPGAGTFSGTPAAGDLGQRDVTITATDSTGSATDTWRLIVSDLTPPQVHAGFTTQIANPDVRDFASVTALPSNTGVQVPPNWSFALGWQWDTFRLARNGTTNGQLFVAARQRYTSSLPAWLRFNNATMTFSGTAPLSGSYPIVVTGTDFWGYTAAQSSFVIQVGDSRALELRGYSLGRTSGVARGRVQATISLANVTLDGADVQPGQVTLGVNGTDFSWLSIDSSNSITGIVPDRYANGTAGGLSVPLTLSATNATPLTATYTLDILPHPFTAFVLPNTTATPGSPYSLNLLPYVRDPATSINASTVPAEAAEWLVWNQQDMSLTGTPPASVSYGVVNVTLTGNRAGVVGSTSMRLAMSGVSTSSGSPSGTSATVPNPTGSTAAAANQSSGGLSKAAKIGLGVGLGVLALLLLLLLLFCCCRRRRREKNDGDRKDNDGDSFVAGPRSPFGAQDPFRKSNNLDAPRSNIIGRMASLGKWQKPPLPQTPSPRPTAASFETNATYVEKPQRVDGLRGIFGWTTGNAGAEEKDTEKPHHIIQEVTTPQLPRRSESFLAHGDVIGIDDPVRRPSQDRASSFTQSFGSSGDSRASWESQRSFQWSSAEGGERSGELDGGNPTAAANRLSAARSIPRPRENFTPRYPRANSPTRLNRLTSGRNLDDSPEFSEFGSPSASDERDHDKAYDTEGFSQRTLDRQRGEDSFTTSHFPSGPSGLNRFGESTDFRTDDDEDEGTDHEGPAVVSMAERQSFETRRPSTKRAGGGGPQPQPRLRPSNQRTTSQPVSGAANPRSSQALGGEAAGGMFDDAEEQNRRSTFAPDPNETETQGLGYPSSAIFFASPNPNNRLSQVESERPASTIQAVSHQHPMSPPLPSVGSFVRPRPISTASTSSATGPPPGTTAKPSAFVGSVGLGPAINVGGATAYSRSKTDSIIPEGRATALANETFSIHPQIHPPPTVSLSAATWSSAPPSTYRAEVVGGGQLPSWLHFDNRELELWGVPSMQHSGETTVIRIVEKMPRDKRNSNPMAYGYVPAQEREVGRVTIDVTDRMRSPQFGLEASPHAL